MAEPFSFPIIGTSITKSLAALIIIFLVILLLQWIRSLNRNKPEIRVYRTPE